MFALLVTAQVIALLAMFGVSVWGWKHVAPETRMQARIGPTGLDYTMGRKTALVSTPLIGILIVGAMLAIADSPERETIASMGLALFLIFLWAHWYSIRRAAR